MGGWGSGRYWRWSTLDTVDDYRSIDIRMMKRRGWLEPNRYIGLTWSRNGEITGSINVRTYHNRVVLSYKHRPSGSRGEWTDEEYPVYLDWTPCNLGGERAWFRCPARGCGRRVALLYGGDIFACRHCHQLAYPSQREATEDRIVRRADRIRERLGWEPGILNPNGYKPKGMHWYTYLRLVREHDAIVDRVLVRLSNQFRLADIPLSSSESEEEP